MISVIIPAYNAGAYLDECLNSVLSQSFSDIEVIVVDDGSTDETGEIISRHAAKDKRVKPITQPNGGPSLAKNTGIEAAKGEEITFVDSDDILLPRALDTLKNVLEKSNCGIAIARLTQQPSKVTIGSGMSLVDSRDAIERVLYQTDKELFNCSPCGKLYRKEMFQTLRYREGVRYEDLDLFYQLFDEAKTIGATKTTVYYYRTNNGSFIRNFSPQRLDVLDVTRRMVEYISANHPELLPAAHDRQFSANFDMYQLLTKVTGYDDVANECWETIKRYRSGLFFNPKVRIKNKIGIIASCFGRQFVALLARHYNKP